MWNDLEMALKGAPHAFGTAKPAFLGDGLDRQSALFESKTCRVSPRPFRKLRRRVSDLAAKEPSKITRAHAHAIRQGFYAGRFATSPNCAAPPNSRYALN
jgi:hypothetical protein